MRPSGHGLVALVVVVVVMGALAPAAHAGLITAGTLFVDLDARDATAGTASWANAGTLGAFVESGDPVVANLGANSNPGVSFNGSTDYYQGDIAPAGLVGPNPTRTIEAWVYNPAIAAEETVVAWGHRGGPTGTNMSFNYGSNPDFGAVGHWGWPDMGYNGTPAAGEWHHLVYTHDGAFTRIYADGELRNVEDHTADLNTHAGTRITVAAQLDNAAGTVTGGLRGSLSIANLRIHDGALTAPDVTNNYNEDAARFGKAVVGPPAPGPVSQYWWRFEDGAGTSTANWGAAGGVATSELASVIDQPDNGTVGWSSQVSNPAGMFLVDPRDGTGMVGNHGSYHFNGSARFNTGIPMAALNNTSWTLEFFAQCDNPNGGWMYPLGNNGYNFFVAGKASGGNGHVLRNHFDTLAGGYSIDLGPGGGYEDGGWHHVAVAFDDTANLIYTYFDYELVHVLYTAGALGNQPGELIIAGGRIAPLSEFWDGYVDEVRVTVGTPLVPAQFLNYGVPEPATLALFGLGALLLRSRRRRNA